MQEKVDTQLEEEIAEDLAGHGASGKVHYFNITFACNSRCRFCAADLVTDCGDRSDQRIPLQIFIELLDGLAVNSSDQVILNGGEPTTHPEFIGFLEAIAQRGAKRTVFTNGRKLADATFTRAIASFQPVELLIPIYSDVEREHDSSTGIAGSFVETIRGITTVIGLQQQGFSLPIEFRLLLSRTTAPHVAEVVQFINQLYPDGDYCFSLNPLIISRQAKIHAAPLFSYQEVFAAVNRECSANLRKLITKNLPRCLVAAVCPEQAISSVFLAHNARSQETYFDPYRLTSATKSEQRDFAAPCGSCLLREACPGFPVGHLQLFGDSEARPLSYDDVIVKTSELMWPMFGENDRISISGCEQVMLPSGADCLVEPKSGSWFVPGAPGVFQHFASRGSSSLAEIESDFPGGGSGLAANLLLSGVGRLNGKNLKPVDDCQSDHNKLNIAALIIKYTRNCNLQCAYCYADGCSSTASSGLSNEAVLAALNSLAPVLADPFDIILHGGEPLTRMEELKELVVALHKHPTAPKMNVSIQTNAVLIGEDFARFLREHDVSIGVSIDGITFEENGFRTFGNGKPSLDLTLEGVKHLLEANMKPGLLTVLHKKNQDGLLDSLKAYASFGITDFVVNPLFPGGAAKNLGPLSFADTDSALETLRNILLWINDENRQRQTGERLYERNLSTLVQHLTSYKRTYMCSRIPCGAGLNTLSIDADGSLYPCDDFLSAPEFRLGSVIGLEDPVRTLTSHPVMTTLHHRSIEKCTPCRGCTWQAMCPSHCAAESYFTAGDIFHGGVQCNIMKKFIPLVLDLLSSRRIDAQFIVRTQQAV